ncbi:MAG: hypothetical protein U0Z44_03340 [Kouleothrix sp.]
MLVETIHDTGLLPHGVFNVVSGWRRGGRMQLRAIPASTKSPLLARPKLAGGSWSWP